MRINWKPVTEIPTDCWERNDALSNPKLVLYSSEGKLMMDWIRYSHVSDVWLVLRMNHDVLAWADISEEDFLKEIKKELKR